MKMIQVLLLSLVALLSPTILQAQSTGRSTTAPAPAPATAATALPGAIMAPVGRASALRRHSVRDSLFYAKYNKYGDLKNDDPNYNPRRPWWLVALKVAGQNVATTSFDRYVLGYGYSKVGPDTWRHNLETGWEWDTDRFGMNFFMHPYSGAAYFNWARSSGYNFYQSIPFAVGGSLTFEYFGENTLPSINDIINTPISGTFFGEVFYRLSSDLLDDRTTGRERFLRELGAAAIDPARGLGRIVSGKISRHTSKEIYQKEPLNITLSTGFRKLNTGSSFGTGTSSVTFNAHFDYGNPFEKRSRKPFDYFKVRTDINPGVGRKVLDNITGLGILAGTNVQVGPLETLVGLFQHYDYWDNKTFELGTLAFGGGVVSKWPLAAHADLYTSVHLNIVPVAGNSTQYGPDTLQVRDYNYGGGLGGKLESTLELGRRVNATFIGYYYWIHTYVGHKGDHYIGIIRPRLEVRCVRNLSLGFEHLVYYSDRYPADFHPIHLVRTEQRIFLKMVYEQFRRKD
jgi:hypothetical protein